MALSPLPPERPRDVGMSGDYSKVNEGKMPVCSARDLGLHLASSWSRLVFVSMPQCLTDQMSEVGCRCLFCFLGQVLNVVENVHRDLGRN